MLVAGRLCVRVQATATTARLGWKGLLIDRVCCGGTSDVAEVDIVGLLCCFEG